MLPDTLWHFLRLLAEETRGLLDLGGDIGEQVRALQWMTCIVFILVSSRCCVLTYAMRIASLGGATQGRATIRSSILYRTLCKNEKLLH
jgi:hypothetical protein